MNRLRVLVCGTNYGRAYLKAISRRKDAFMLVGVLARGSRRSHLVAAENGVPLYVDPRELGKDRVDLACAAMSSSAWQVVIKLLEQGIHVLCEHPQVSSALTAGLRLASRRKIKLHLNGHFGNLPAARAFTKQCSRLRKEENPVFLQALATERSLYGLLDILKLSLGSLNPCRIRVLHRHKRFCLLSGTMGRLPSYLLVQVSGTGRRRLPDGSPAYLFDHRVAVGFPSGVLTLMSMSGPVLWNSAPAHTRGTRGLLWTSLYDQGTRTWDDLWGQRLEANIAALESIRQAILGGQTAEAQRPSHILEVSRAWESIGKCLYAA